MSAAGVLRGSPVIGLIGLVGLAALADLWTALRPGLEPASPETLAKARALVLERRRPGTLVLHSPLFGVEALAGLGDLPARPDLPSPEARAGRAVLVVDRDEVPMRGLGDPAEVIDVGPGVVLRVFSPRGAAEGRRPVYDLRDGLDARTLRIERPPGRVVSRCTETRPEGGFQCPGQASWLYAAPRRLRVDGEDADCVWAHPTAGGAVVFEVPPPSPPPEGHRLELELGAALTDDAVRQTPDGAAVTTRVAQGGRTLGRVVRTNAIGWARRSFAVAPGEPIALEVTAPKDGRRHHCLTARVFEVEEEGDE